MANRPPIHQIRSFAIVGTIGFVVNAVGLKIATFVVGPIPAQIFAFPLAVTVTWWLNRYFTFASQRPWRSEWLRYASANVLGWLVMNGMYVALVLSNAFLHDHPVIALAVASLAGMGFNFASSKWIVFRQPRSMSHIEKNRT